MVEAEDGEEGLDRASRELPDLVLMDLSLPRMDGWETTRRMKANSALRHIPVIAVDRARGSRRAEPRTRRRLHRVPHEATRA